MIRQPYLEFFVKGAPTAKARPRYTGKGRCYTPAKTAFYENMVRAKATEVLATRYGRIKPLTGPLNICLQFILPIPKCWSNKDRALAYEGWLLPATKPDIDNYQKAVLDGLNKVLFQDDAQVVSLYSTKRYINVLFNDVGCAIRIEQANADPAALRGL